jgi:hypothetical protein
MEAALEPGWRNRLHQRHTALNGERLSNSTADEPERFVRTLHCSQHVHKAKSGKSARTKLRDVERAVLFAVTCCHPACFSARVIANIRKGDFKATPIIFRRIAHKVASRERDDCNEINRNSTSRVQTDRRIREIAAPCIDVARELALDINHVIVIAQTQEEIAWRRIAIDDDQFPLAIQERKLQLTIEHFKLGEITSDDDVLSLRG